MRKITSADVWTTKDREGGTSNSLPRGSIVYTAKNDYGHLIQRGCMILRIVNRLGIFFAFFDVVVYCFIS